MLAFDSRENKKEQRREENVLNRIDIRGAVAALMISQLVGCGGGGGGAGSEGGGTSPPPTPLSLQGVAAVGAALASAPINAKCADGTRLTTTSSSLGEYTLQIPSALYPCLIQAISPTDTTVLQSIATAAGTVNITPLTAMVVARLLKQPAGDAFEAFPSASLVSAISTANISKAQADVRAGLNGLVDLSNTPDLISTAFKAGNSSTAGDAVDKTLDALGTVLRSKGSTYISVATELSKGGSGAALNQALTAGSLTVNPFAKPWYQQQRNGRGGFRLGTVNGDLVSYASGYMVSKDNGSTWSEKYPIRLIDIAVSFNNRLVVFSSFFNYSSSADNGLTWTQYYRLPGISPQYDNYSNGVQCVLATGGKLYAYTSIDYGAQTWVSLDGITFTKATDTLSAAFQSELTTRKIATRDCDGVIDGPKNLLRDVVTDPLRSRYFKITSVNNPLYVPSSSFTRFYNYTLSVSSDNKSWQPVDIPPNISFASIAEVGNGRFIGLATQEGERPFESIGITMLSTDFGLTWKNVGGVDNPAAEFLNSLAAIGDVNVAVGTYGAVRISSDQGLSWRVVASVTANELRDVTSNGSLFVAVGDRGTIILSSDRGTTWNLQASGVTDDLRSIAYGGGKFLAISPTGTVITSSDGAKWEKATAGLTSFGPLTPVAKVAYGSGSFVASFATAGCVAGSCSSGSPGVFYSSDGGATWNRSLPNGSWMTFGGGAFVTQDITDSIGTVLVSTDGGKSWRKKVSMPLGGRIAYGNGVLAQASSVRQSDGGYHAGADVSEDFGDTWRHVEIGGGIGSSLFFNGNRWIGLGGFGINRLIAASVPQ